MNQNTQQTKSARNKPRYGRPSTPPNLFTDKKQKPALSRTKRLLIQFAFIGASLTILLFPYRANVKAEGKVIPAKIYSVDSPVTGTVTQVFQEEGSEVNKGDRLLHLKSHELELQIKQSEKEIEIIQTEIAILEKDKAIQSQLVKKNLVYFETGSISESDKQIAEQKLQQMKERQALLLKRKEQALNRQSYLQSLSEALLIHSPVKGIVLTNLRDYAGRTIREGEQAVKIANRDFTLEVLVTEDLASSLHTGNKASIRFLSKPFQTYRGTIEKMDSKVDERIEQIWNKRSVIRVLVKPDTALQLKSGMEARVQFKANQKTNLLQQIVKQIIF